MKGLSHSFLGASEGPLPLEARVSYPPPHPQGAFCYYATSCRESVFLQFAECTEQLELQHPRSSCFPFGLPSTLYGACHLPEEQNKREAQGSLLISAVPEQVTR
jgi:hypothetical protein